VPVCALLFALAGTVRGAGLPPAPSIDSPGWHAAEAWNPSQGLPQATISALLQTRDGYLWLGSKGGLARFDGVRFTTFTDVEGGELTEYEVWALAESRDGTLWFGTYGGGLGSMRDGVIRQYTTRDGLVNDFVVALCEDAQGTLWIGTDKGLSRREGERFVAYDDKDALQGGVKALTCEGNGVWIGNGKGGLTHFVDGRSEHVSLPPGSFDAVRSIARTPDGALWVTFTESVLRLKDGLWTPFTAAGRNARLYVSAAGDLWIGGGLGILRFQDGRFVPHDIRVGASEKQNITAMTGDHEGSLWVGHGGAGLVRLARGSFVSFSKKEGLLGPYVSAVFEDSRGDVWIGTASGLNRLRNGAMEAVLPRSGAVLVVRALAEDAEGWLWVGTDTDVHRLRPPDTCPAAGCIVDLQTVDPGALRRLNTRTLHRDRQGAMWVGTDQDGLVRYDAGRPTVYTTKDGLSDDGIRGIEDDGHGGLWVGTKAGGVCHLEAGRFRCLGEKDGLASNLVQDVYQEDGDGALWIATRTGINRLKGGRLTTYKTSDGLFARHVYSFAEDGRGSMWMGSGRGVFRVSKRELDDFAEGRVKTVRSYRYGPEHGLSSSVASVGSHPALCRTRDGHLWIATTDGLSVVDPEKVSTNPLSPRVHIEEARVDGVSYDLRRTAQVPPGRGDVEFRYSALSFVAPGRVRFKVRLEPYDTDWIDAGGLRAMQYRNIPPGRYTFRVIAANSDGVWNETGARFDLALTPHFYQTTWFYALCAAAAVLLGAGTQLVRVRALKARERELSVRVRTLAGMLPICASCKKIRDDSGYWNQMEAYMQQHNVAEFSHGICPDCIEHLYPDYAESQKAEKPPLA
jgi:hypothetical protein